MARVVIQVKDLSKQYTIKSLQPRYKTIREELGEILISRINRVLRSGNILQRSSNEIIWALKDISFDVEQGSVLGIIGRNGAGKSTLLKILSRITKPTAGFAKIFGRLGSLLEVGTGFHAELTGRENIYLNGAILGMKQVEIERRFDEIVEFSEIEKFLDTPVKRYSSGMYVRLAFAVAAHLEPEILVVDEVLAVGDSAFQKKCLGKMGDISRSGRTVLFVSHNIGAVSQLCTQVAWVEKGQLVQIGPVYEVIQRYLEFTSDSVAGAWTNSGKYNIQPEIKILSASIRKASGEQAAVVRFDKMFTLFIIYEVLKSIETWSLVFRVVDSFGVSVFTSWDSDNLESDKPTQRGTYQAKCEVPAKLLRPGIYTVTLGTYTPRSGEYNLHERAFQFEVSSLGYTLNPNRWGVITPILNWSIERST
jgi:lipopolysaccharide transport system ATP-binding protein